MEQVIGRIEAALTRIENAASRPRPTNAASDHALDDLQARHDRLQQAIIRSLAQVDALIADESA